MPKLETVARLLGYEYHPAIHIEGPWWSRGSLECDTPPLYDTDANASRELLAYVKAKDRRLLFARAVMQVLHDIEGADGVLAHFKNERETAQKIADDESVEEVECAGLVWAMLNATPQQIYAAFCATFARELEQVEKQS